MRLIALLALAALAPLASAQGSAYASANFGEAKYEIECAAPLTCDEKDKAYKLGLGWQFNRYVAAELAYTDLGQADIEGSAFGAYLHATAYEASAIGTYPLGDTIFSLLGRLGLAYAKTKYGRDLEGESTATSLTYGAGLQLDFTKNVGVRLQWQRFDVDEGGDIDMLSFGILLRAR
jgi:opacity protein-like surface antigen